MFKVVSIEDRAFLNTPRVSSVQLPVSIETIGKESFKGCGATSITIPLGSLSKIGTRAFSDSKLSSISIPSSVKTIGVGTFMNCRELETVSLSDNLRAIPDSAFYQCESLRGEILLPKRAASIGHYAFLGCVNVRAVRFNEIVKSIGSCAFAYCKSIKALLLPESLYEIGWGAFIDTGIYEITIPSKIKTLHKYLFYGSSIRTIVLNGNLEKKEDYCFAGLRTFKIITPQSVECNDNIFFERYYQEEVHSQSDKIAFDNEVRKNLKKAKAITTVDDITVYGVRDDIPSLLSFGCTHLPDKMISAGGNDYQVIYSPEPGVEYGQLCIEEWDNGQDGDIRIPDIIIVRNTGEEKKYIVTKLGYAIFDKNKYKHHTDHRKNANSLSSITSVETGIFVKSSYKEPFSGCTAKTIKMATTVVSRYLFSGSAIEKWYLPKGMEEIPDGYFKDCKNLKEVSVPSTVTRIGKDAFGNSSIATIVIPDGVEIIDDKAFSQCKELKEVSFPSTLNKIGYAAFSGCSNLKKVSLPESLDEIGQDAFSGCGFEMFVLPAHFDKICRNSIRFFDGCTNLKILKFAEGTTRIPAYLCINLTSLERIILPSTVEMIGWSAFEKTSIKSLDLPNLIKDIGNKAFYGCIIDCVVIPASVSHLGDFAFEGTRKIQIKCDPKVISRSRAVNKECVVEVIK